MSRLAADFAHSQANVGGAIVAGLWGSTERVSQVTFNRVDGPIGRVPRTSAPPSPVIMAPRRLEKSENSKETYGTGTVSLYGVPIKTHAFVALYKVAQKNFHLFWTIITPYWVDQFQPNFNCIYYGTLLIIDVN